MTEVRTTSATGGQKGVKDERYDLVPIDPLAQLARLYGFGAEKYEDHNWRKGYEWSKSYAAAMRHMTQFWNGEDIDSESGLPHVISAVFHMFTLAQFMQDFPEFDDRYKVGTPKFEGDGGPVFVPEYPFTDKLNEWMFNLGQTNIYNQVAAYTPNFWDEPESDAYYPGEETYELESPPWAAGDKVDLFPVTLEGPAGPQSFTLVIRNGN